MLAMLNCRFFPGGALAPLCSCVGIEERRPTGSIVSHISQVNRAAIPLASLKSNDSLDIASLQWSSEKINIASLGPHGADGARD